MIVKCLSVKLPWAAMIADGRKKVEFRTWTTKYQGPLVVVASKKNLPGYSKDSRAGKTLCVVEIEAIDGLSSCDCNEPGFPVDFVITGKQYYSWCLGNPIRVNPVPIKGQLGIYERDIIDESIIAAVNTFASNLPAEKK